MMGNTKYSFEDMEKIVDSISKIKKKSYLEKIRDIIIDNNPNIKITENTNGLFFHFDNLTNNTYKEIEIYIRKISKKKKHTENSNTLSEYIPYSTDEYVFNKNGTREFATLLQNGKMKYTSKEKVLMKRNIYYSEISSGNEDINNSDIFIKKNSKN